MKECNVSDLIHLGIGDGHQTAQGDDEPSQPLHFCELAVSPSGGGGVGFYTVGDKIRVGIAIKSQDSDDHNLF